MPAKKVVIICLAIIVFVLLVMAALAHEALTGWTYDYDCCSSYDCREVPTSWVVITPEGYVVGPKKELISYNDSRIRQSKDEFFHWCTVSGSDYTKTICLYVPLSAF